MRRNASVFGGGAGRYARRPQDRGPSRVPAGADLLEEADLAEIGVHLEDLHARRPCRRRAWTGRGPAPDAARGAPGRALAGPSCGRSPTRGRSGRTDHRSRWERRRISAQSSASIFSSLLAGEAAEHLRHARQSSLLRSRGRGRSEIEYLVEGGLVGHQTPAHEGVAGPGDVLEGELEEVGRADITLSRRGRPCPPRRRGRSRAGSRWTPGARGTPLTKRRSIHEKPSRRRRRRTGSSKRFWTGLIGRRPPGEDGHDRASEGAPRRSTCARRQGEVPTQVQAGQRLAASSTFARRRGRVHLQLLGSQRVGVPSPLARRRGDSVLPGGAGRGPGPHAPVPRGGPPSRGAWRRGALTATSRAWPGAPGNSPGGGRARPPRSPPDGEPGRRVRDRCDADRPVVGRSGTTAGSSGRAVSGGPGACGGLQARRGGSWEGDREGDAPPQGGQGGPCRRPGRRRPRKETAPSRLSQGRRRAPRRPRKVDTFQTAVHNGGEATRSGPGRCATGAIMHPGGSPASTPGRQPAPLPPLPACCTVGTRAPPSPAPGDRAPPAPGPPCGRRGARGVGRQPDRGRERRRAQVLAHRGPSTSLLGRYTRYTPARERAAVHRVWAATDER